MLGLRRRRWADFKPAFKPALDQSLSVLQLLDSLCVVVSYVRKCVVSTKEALPFVVVQLIILYQ